MYRVRSLLEDACEDTTVRYLTYRELERDATSDLILFYVLIFILRTKPIYFLYLFKL